MELDEAFLPETIILDIDMLKEVLLEFADSLSATDWQSHTEKGNRGWTVLETMAHLAITAEHFNDLVEAALVGKPLYQQDDIARDSLSDINQSGIEELSSLQPDALMTRFMTALEQTQAQCRNLKPSLYTFNVPSPLYNRGGTVSEYWAWQICHIGIVHAAQLTRFTTKKPLWQSFPIEMQRRNITRFVAQFSHVYWPERGGKLHGAINLIVGEDAWHIFLASDGGTYAVGKHPKALITLKFRNFDALGRIFTLDLKPIPAVLTGKVWVTGNIFLALRMPELFKPA